MNLRSIESQIKKLNERLDEIDCTQYSFKRDDDGNLIVTVGDESYKLPTVKFRPYQLDVQNALYRDNMLRMFCVWPRRSGKEVTSWNLLLQAAIEKPGLYLMVYPTNVRARMVLWDGAMVTDDGGSFKFLDMIPRRFVVGKPRNDEMSVRLINGSVIHVLGSDVDPDKLRGTNPRGVVISEFAFCDPRVMHILFPILRQNGGWLFLQTTFNGTNHAYTHYQNIKEDPDWHVRVESVETLRDENNERYVTDEMIQKDRASGMPEYLIQQEYYSAVQLNEETMYFAIQMKFLHENDRIISDLIVPNSPVFGFWDLGRRDQNYVLLVQIYRGDPVVIGCINSNNKTPDYYFDEARRFCVRRGLVMRTHFLPHDGAKRDYNSGKDTKDIAQELGEDVVIVQRPPSKMDAITQCRKMIYRCQFNKEHTLRLIECLSNYSKEFDKKSGDYKPEPLHNWASHGVDAFQTMALAIDAQMVDVPTRDVLYNVA